MLIEGYFTVYLTSTPQNSKLIVRASVGAQGVKMLPAALISHIDASSSPGYYTSNTTPFNTPGKGEEHGLRPWVSVTQVLDTEALDSCFSLELQPFGK